jgi:predicted nucleotidyltransferase
METTRNKLTSYEIHFFHNLSNYLDTKLYFFGSIQRGDYFPSSSDIDVDIFTENMSSTIIKMMNYLNVTRNDFKKFVWKLNINNQLVSGYKLMYKEPERKFAVEFSLYDEKYKTEILQEHKSKSILPFYATILLIIIKYLFYTLNIIPGLWYTNAKKFILSYMIGKDYDHFVVIDMKNPTAT